MLREHGLISTTLDAAVVYLLVKVKGMLIGWLKHVYPLLGFTINTSYTLVLLGPRTQQKRAARCLVPTFTSLATSKSYGIISPSLAQLVTPARLQKRYDNRSLPL